MTDWKAVIMNAREAEAGVTDKGKKMLKIEALGHGCTVDDAGNIIDAATGETPKRETLNQIWKDTRIQMHTVSDTGKELLEQLA